ncbi:MAG: ThuA domain-containing protein [Algibacter sp.]
MKKKILSSLFIFLSLTSTLSAHDFKVLVFHKTAGFAHTSIPDGINMIQQLGTDNAFAVDVTNDASLFTLAYLQDYAAVIFLSTTGDVLDSAQQTAFEQYIQGGGGYLGIHAASDTEYDWNWYGDLVGAYFSGHPSGTPTATVKISDRVHPSTEDLPFSWTTTDEWYNFATNPRGNVHVLATVDESTYSGGTMGYDHPISWCHDYDGGRAWYTALGHTSAMYSDENFKKHVLGGIYYAVEEVTGVFDATVDSKFDVSIIDNSPSNPLALAILPDLKILYIERTGSVKLYNQTTGVKTTALQLNVDSDREDGLLGIALDPNFETNNWLYLFYSPSGTEYKQHLSRFTFEDDAIDIDSEIILLEVPTQRETCCHSGGDLEFDSNGNLYISLGDNINPFKSDGYSPIDERDGRQNYDAQGTSANTKDYRGKILRIKPEIDGTYSIPSGNLFTDTNNGLLEIYSMGHRNPFRIALSPDNYLYIGEVGPDSNNNSNSRGSRGHDEFNRTNVAANFGWPYAVANNQAYVDYNFETGVSGSPFDVNNLVNDSPNNTGVYNIPPATPAWIWYSDAESTEFPEMGVDGGRTAMAGAIYSYNSGSTSEVKFPEYYNNSVFIYEWARNWIREVKLDDFGNIVKINPFYESLELNRPIDMDFGPDGAMYIIEWGTGFGGNNSDARIIKVSFIDGNRTPIAIASADPEAGTLPLTVNFNASDSYDPDIGDSLTYEWDFDGDGTFDATGLTPSNIYTVSGTYNVQLKVTDTEGLNAFATIKVNAGNNLPSVNIDYPADGGFYAWGEEIEFKISVTDVEDGTIACEDIEALPAVGHSDHKHDFNSISNCEGSFITESHGDDADDVFYTFTGAYTDNGVINVEPSTGSKTHLLQPKKKEAEYYTSQSGIQTQSTSDPVGGGINVGWINNNDYISFNPINLEGITHITFRAASKTNGGYIEVRTDSENGTLIGKRYIAVTGGDQIWDYFTIPIEPLTGTHELFFKFTSTTTNGFLINLNWIEFHGKGVAQEDIYGLNGLVGSYYNSSDFSGTSTEVKDPLVAFNWEDASPVSGINADAFSVRWEGYLQPDTTGDFKIYTNHTNGSVKVVLNGTEIINKGTGGETTSASVSLNAGAMYSISIEYIHTSGDAAISLGWAENETIYKTNLFTTNALNIKDDVADVENIKVFPNPFNTKITINSYSQKVKFIELYNLTGALIKTFQTDQNKNIQDIDLSNLQDGLYLLKINTNNNRVYKKIIKN